MKIPIKSISVLDRDRLDYGDIFQLAESLKTHGLIQPIVVRQIDDNKYQLIAGGRRLRAAIAAGWIDIGAVERQNCDDLTLKFLELEENIARKELLWSEEVAAKAKLDELKRIQHGSKTSGRYESEGWTIEDTATMLDESVANVSRDIKLAKAMKDDKKLAAELIKFPKTVAFKKLQQKEEQAKMERHVKSQDFELNTSLHLGDCLSLIDELENESIDLWLTDPPYAVDDINVASGTYNTLMTATANSTAEIMARVYEQLIPKVYQKLKPGSHFYIFLGNEWYQFLVDCLTEAGFIIDPVLLIWEKNVSTTIFLGYNYPSKYEPILYGCKPPRTKYLHQAVNNVIKIDRVTKNTQAHTFHKPPELIDLFIKQSTNPGDTVLDTFAGSGQTLESANRLKRHGIGFELDRDTFNKAQVYLKECRDGTTSS